MPAQIQTCIQMLLRPDMNVVEKPLKCPCRHCILHPRKSDSLGYKDVDGRELPCCALSFRISSFSSAPTVHFNNWYIFKLCALMHRCIVFHVYSSNWWTFVINSAAWRTTHAGKCHLKPVWSCSVKCGLTHSLPRQIKQHKNSSVLKQVLFDEVITFYYWSTSENQYLCIS